MKKISVVFWGTPQFSVPCLESLIHDPFIQVIGVITQPDKPSGRSGTPVPSPIKNIAEQNAIPVYQPAGKNDFTKTLSTIGAYDCNIVVAYGKLIPEASLRHPKFGSINVHPSALPKYRGPSPIQAALLHGDKNSAITIMLLDEQMDHGPILAQKSVAIQPDQTYSSLSDQLAQMSAPLLVTTITQYVAGNLSPKEQNHAKATLTHLFTKQDGEVIWNEPLETIYNKFRAFTPWPSVYTFWRGKRLIFSSAVRSSKKHQTPGSVRIEKDTLYIGTKTNPLEILELQLEGKARQATKDFIKGNPKINGVVLPN